MKPFVTISNAINNACLPIEIMSSGSTIETICNDTHLTFLYSENSDRVIQWDSNDNLCQKSPVLYHDKYMLNANVNRCSIKKINNTYLSAMLVSRIKDNPTYGERACVYCKINRTLILPTVTVIQTSQRFYQPLYTFTLTTDRLAVNESFEVLWIKRMSAAIKHSLDYLVTKTCINPRMTIISNKNRQSNTFSFTLDDVQLQFIEFIIRKCDESCRQYQQCTEEQFYSDFDQTNFFDRPGDIEKVLLNSNCRFNSWTVDHMKMLLLVIGLGSFFFGILSTIITVCVLQKVRLPQRNKKNNNHIYISAKLDNIQEMS
ncbi:unnamed protein product [Didymodactylos carnosus]|uniref:Uncharacterized protein n=1 Tax=Didymodactylos carnosus TaxID=1234261 RepID=A0A814VAW4_9BILA|nr:unnamed protein product [Didymodactylos carnosus]CAF3949851.1 unnamed protein product [Didymodactylos carnosus]